MRSIAKKPTGGQATGATRRLGLAIGVESGCYVPAGSRAAELERSNVAAWQPEPSCGFNGMVDPDAHTPDRLLMVEETYTRIRGRIEAEALGTGEPPPERPHEWQVWWCILGIGVQWLAVPAPGEPCPGCKNQPLRGCQYCCLCDRSSWDARLPSVSTPTPRRAPRGDRLMGGV
jgi:hypothetical protein